MRITHLPASHAGGSAPLVEITGLCQARVLARCEGHNEFGSIKSRMVRHLLLQALGNGRLQRGDRVIEASSGNTGMALAGIGAELGLKVSIVLLEGADPEIVNRLTSYRADLHFCDRALGMRGMLDFISKHHGGVFTIDQFRNKAIVDAYAQTHAVELLSQLDGIAFAPDYLFACVGTGGTLQGIGRILRQRWPSVCVVGVEKDKSIAPIDGIRNTDVAYFGEADIYDKGFPDVTLYADKCLALPPELAGSPSCGALLEVIRRYPFSHQHKVLAILCDGRVTAIESARASDMQQPRGATV